MIKEKLKINCKYDKMFSIAVLKKNKLNEKLYGELEKDRTYITNLKETILEEGLHEAIDVYAGTNEMDSGHNRIISLSEAGITEVPGNYVKRPKGELERLERIASKNMRKPLTVTEKYRGVKLLCTEYIKKYNDISDTQKTRYCSKFSTTFKTYSMLDEILLEGRQDLFDRIDADEDKLSVSVAYKQMLDDKKNTTQLSSSPALIDFITEDHIKKTMLSVSDAISKIYKTENWINAKSYQFVPDFQENFLSALLHDNFSHSLTQVLIDDTNVDCEAPRNHTIYDLTMPGHSWQPEVKVAKYNGKDVSKIKWLTSSQKSGYYFLIASDTNVERFYVAYGFIDGDKFERAGRFATLDLKSAHSCNLRTFIGKITKSKKQNKNIYSCYLDPVRIGKK